MHEWLLFPLSLLISLLATGSGFGGRIILFSLLTYFFGTSIPEAVSTALVTELCGKFSAIMQYTRQRQVEFDIALPMILIAFPGFFIGLHFIRIFNPHYLSILSALVIISFAVWFLSSMKFGEAKRNSHLLFEDISGHSWVSFFGGLLSGISASGMTETIVPVLERKYNLEIHRAVATAVLIEGGILSMAAAMTLWEWPIKWDLAFFTITGVLLGGQLGPRVAKHITNKRVKLIFSTFIILSGIVMIRKSIGFL